MDEYKTLIIDGLKQIVGRKVDFILNVHVDQGMETNPAFEREVLYSQSGVKELLKLGHYDLIGYETSTEENVTAESLGREMYTYQGQMTGLGGERHTYEDYRNRVAWLKDFDGVLQYQEEVPASAVTGVEDLALLDLHGSVLNMISQTEAEHGRSPRHSQYHECSEAIRAFRSEIFMAKIGRMLHLRELQKAVIVVGARHAPDLKRIAQDLGLESGFFQTASKEFSRHAGLSF